MWLITKTSYLAIKKENTKSKSKIEEFLIKIYSVFINYLDCKIELSGMALWTRNAIYKACWYFGYCMSFDILAAIDKATEDKVMSCPYRLR